MPAPPTILAVASKGAGEGFAGAREKRGCRSDREAAADGLYRDLQVADAVGLGRRKPARADVDLDRRQQQPRDGEARIASFAHRDEVLFGNRVMDMDAGAALLADGAFPAVVVASRRLVVVAHEQAGLVGQREQAPDRAI